MLQAEYEKLPCYEIPAAVDAASEWIETGLGQVAVYRFDEGHINVWWRDHGPLHERMMKLTEGRAEWNRGGHAWHVAAVDADAIVEGVRAI
ncbi:hypothetical protein [Aureimonas sp. SK2]|uniref:hypothetical protein n=1 Tax=Aureimonas sp. SK2 TaxID=3015992 RepID=UPI002443F251|nr:hypothetical protein [Aureimonas sp. SK2]